MRTAWIVKNKKTEDLMGERADSSRVPIFVFIPTRSVRKHFLGVLNEIGHNAVVIESAPSLLDQIAQVQRSVVFIEGVISRKEGRSLYNAILRRCPGAKIVLVCSRGDRGLIKDVIEQGGYGSVVEPYDAWEIGTMVKHLITDLSTLDSTSEAEV